MPKVPQTAILTTADLNVLEVFKNRVLLEIPRNTLDIAHPNVLEWLENGIFVQSLRKRFKQWPDATFLTCSKTECN